MASYNKQRKGNSKFKIGNKVQHINAGWTAIVKSVKYDYAHGLGKRSSKKIYLYTLKDKNGREILGLWGEAELKKV